MIIIGYRCLVEVGYQSYNYHRISVNYECGIGIKYLKIIFGFMGALWKCMGYLSYNYHWLSMPFGRGIQARYLQIINGYRCLYMNYNI